MRNYELVLILDPQLGENSFEGVITRYEEQLTGSGGQMVNIDRWGLRKLAYTSIGLKRRSQGYFVLYQFTGEPAQLGPLEQRLKVDEDVLRHMVTAVAGEFMRVPQLAPEGEILGAPRSARGDGGRPGPGRGAPAADSRPPAAKSEQTSESSGDSEGKESADAPAPEADGGTEAGEEAKESGEGVKAEEATEKAG